jgi:hypothetical protein
MENQEKLATQGTQDGEKNQTCETNPSQDIDNNIILYYIPLLTISLFEITDSL